MKMFCRTDPLEIYVYEKYVEDVKSFLLSCNILSEKMGFNILYKPFRENEKFLVNDALKILPRENSHLEQLKKYIQYSEQSFYATSFLFSYQNKNIMYTADIGSKDDLELFNDFHLDILISEITHITISDLFEKIKLLGSPRTFITHITEEDEPEINIFLKNLTKKEGKIELAADCQIIEF
jgi:hypothetical protein